ncbi:MAG: alanine transaminase [Zetaproteobacteria bacterium CG06_land_8_20_14_3_00_59_53]|nr:MAG: alanine transaminase [Zetaproteobacteria bacterium CG2_30_59_37]PIO90828.1 MAG: alanine transaminase [Zetaproteobacteria bacterium CG23_combo_of_CG06-09_8_20_14_all_59_86]PIQ64697.1 MAG: alanine transaminase [Zetaproteobacteria bacterium CG11_big_fil_rev_8_21_14_0_20_59_439]PIU71137.1 MAG: alanine transaminase [Zetaproteobacteria bacterium CG06_land_8_20_14_3_00_59_53]PIU96631.1 MAG: alanine transaminase [Zetaproteobacteria bacterium CG03_land_8_20_14_0_80_59_51]PIY46235.1 MAG: alanine
MREFDKIKRLPPYVFAVVNKLKMELRHAGHDIIDLGMGNPDQPTPQHIVDKLCEAAQDGRNHRYSVSRGIPGLRRAICAWYKTKFDVDLDPETEAIATIGSKEGLAHLAVAITSPGDLILTPNPAYPIHPYGFIIAGADIRHVPMGPGFDYFEEVQKAVRDSWPKPKILVVNFPSNPTAEVVDLDFYVKLVDFARENDLIVISDIAYAEITFDGYKCPSIMQVPGAKDVAVEFYSLSKTYNMPGWRMGFMVGNREIVAALAKIKSYLDYGTFQPLQIAACAALNGPQDCVDDIRAMYQSRRDVMIDGLHKMGWMAEKPKASMFIWAEIPDEFKALGSLEFCKQMLEQGGVAVSPGIGFGDYGDHYVRIALIENEHRTRQAIRGMRQFLHGGK